VNKWARQRRSHRGKTIGDGETNFREAEVACVKQGTIWIWEEGKQGIYRERCKEER